MPQNMASKLGKCTDATTKKLEKQFLEQKINILDELECVETEPSIGRHFDINESTIRTIKRSQAAIRASIETRALRSAEVTYRSCDP